MFICVDHNVYNPQASFKPSFSKIQHNLKDAVLKYQVTQLDKIYNNNSTDKYNNNRGFEILVRLPKQDNFLNHAKHKKYLNCRNNFRLFKTLYGKT